jgi:hypothetical protein
MRTIGKLALAGLTVTLCMSLAVSTASAARLSMSSRTFRLTWSSLRFEELEFGSTFACPVTLDGSFNSSTIRKVMSAVIGYVNRAAHGTCTGTVEEFEFGQETLPWAVKYQSFTGTLPNITSIGLTRESDTIRHRVGAVVCVYRRVGAGTGLSIGAGGAVTAITETAVNWTLIQGMHPPCPSAERMNGNGSVSVLGTTTAISVRLI